MNRQIEQIRCEIMHHESNGAFAGCGYKPLFVADERAKIVIVGHAPGIKAQEREKAWADASGERLMKWLGISEEIFRDKTKIAILPMDFYYQGKGKAGDLPPRKDFAPLWHAPILACMPQAELFVLAGRYAHQYYLANICKHNLTETVRAYGEYLPKYFPIVHPSPLNFRWLMKNPWFEKEVVNDLQHHIRCVLQKT